MENVLPASIALFAFGALFMGSVLLLLLNPKSRDLRWWLVFMAANMVWLAGQGWAFATGSWEGVRTLVNATVHLLPAFFVAFALAGLHGRPNRFGILPIGLGVLLLPLSLCCPSDSRVGWLVAAWHVGMWGLGTVLLLQARWIKPVRTPPDRAGSPAPAPLPLLPDQ